MMRNWFKWLKILLLYFVGWKKDKRGEKCRHIFASWFRKSFFSFPPPLREGISVGFGVGVNKKKKKKPQICLQIYFTIVFSDPNFGG